MATLVKRVITIYLGCPDGNLVSLEYLTVVPLVPKCHVKSLGGSTGTLVS